MRPPRSRLIRPQASSAPSAGQLGDQREPAIRIGRILGGCYKHGHQSALILRGTIRLISKAAGVEYIVPVQQWSTAKMAQPNFCELLDELFELDPGTTNGSTVLKEIPSWSSLTFVGLIAMIDEEYGIALSPGVIMSSETAGDLEQKLQEMLTASEAA